MPPVVFRVAASVAACLSVLAVAAPAGQAEARFFAVDSVWNQPLAASQPLDPRSASYVAELRRMSRPRRQGGWGTGVMTTRFGVPIYTVGAGEPRVRVRLTTSASPALQQAFEAVPVPVGAVAAAGTDQNMAVYQPATDTLWEFWHMRRGAGGWQADFGGRMIAMSRSPGFYRDLADVDGRVLERSHWGTTAAKASLVAGVITVAELRDGSIDHALHLSVPQARAGVFSAPAQATDGQSTAAGTVPLGARFRLDPKLDVATLRLPPAVDSIARAAQRYGIIVVNTGGAVGFRAEDPAQYGADPYPALFGGHPDWALMQRFPWDRLQMLPLDLRATAKSSKRAR